MTAPGLNMIAALRLLFTDSSALRTQKLQTMLNAIKALYAHSDVTLNNATGDGTTDDATALNAWLASGGIKELPPGRYRIGSPLVIPSDTHFRMAPGAVLLPASAGLLMILVEGAEPASWTSLTTNIAKGAKTFLHTSNAYAVGDWVVFRSDALVPGPNSTGSLIACVRKIVKKTGPSAGDYTYTLNKPVLDAYLTADSAEVGVASMIENVILENVAINEENYTTLIGNGISLSYCARARVINPIIIGSKEKVGADVTSPNGIRVNHGSFDISIENPTIKHIGWYGISISNCEKVRVLGGRAEDTRHAVSCVWTTYGEPTDVLVQGMTSSNSTLSGFDTHDTGRDIVFEGCVSVGAGDDGFQFRSLNVRATNCTARGSTNDGFADGTGDYGHVLVGCIAEANGRLGFNFSGFTELIGCHSIGHVGPVSGYGGVLLQAGGVIRGGRFTGNGNYAFRVYDAPLLIESVYAPADAVQTVLAGAITASGGRFNKVQFRNCEIPGYALNSIFARQQASRPAGDLPPITSGNRLTDDAAGDEQNGEATLVAGTATVTTTAVKRLTATNWTEDVISRIDLRRVTPGGTVGDLYIEAVTHETSFVIRSTNVLDTSKVRWTVEL